MRFISILLSVVLLPLQAVALDYSNTSLLYTDAPFTPAESAGISFLTNLGAVEGNPDGTFRPNRTLNRAEFTKIALSSVPNIRVSVSDATNCFPDVDLEDWFSRYVCLAEKRGIVQGYPDGLFHPERSVNYAEALKILGELYNYTAYAEEGTPWYTMYVQAAINHKTILPMSLPYDRFLTRGQMARLSAAYRAEAEEELVYYREFERGEYVVIEEEIIEEEIIEEEEVIEEEVIEDNNWDEENLPAVSRLMQVGERSKPIAEGRFTPWSDNVIIRIAEVQLEREIPSIKSMYLLNDQGEEIGEFILDIYDQYSRTWKARFTASGGYLLPRGEATVLAIEVVIKEQGHGGVSEELIEVNEFSLTVQNVSDNKSSQLVAVAKVFPVHQTVLGKITGIKNLLSGASTVKQDTDVMLGSFLFTGSTVSIAPLAVTKLKFTVNKSYGVYTSNWELGTSDSSDRHNCSVESLTRINCLAIPSSMGALNGGERILNIYASVELEDTGPGKTVQVGLQSPGELGESGSVWWSDGTGDFTWLELPEPLATGTLWTLEP